MGGTSVKIREKPKRPRFSKAELDRLIAEATVDAYDEDEQMSGFYTALEDSLEVPFKTQVLGVEVLVERLDMAEDGAIVAVCARDKFRQKISILELPLPTPPPEGSVWIEAYRRWAGGR
jgi:predicted regulator of amino acid metabolism with ACT domain